MKRSEKAVEFFRNKFNCSQSVFVVFGSEHGLTEDLCLRTGCAFGGGMGRQQYTCGAVTGALMAIGLIHGKGINDPEEKKQKTYELTREFFKKFEQLHHSTTCMELLDNLSLNDPDDHKKILERGLFETRCERYVEDAVKIVENLKI
jgi:C_GCAxxG_C_C family probable redox protein